MLIQVSNWCRVPIRQCSAMLGSLRRLVPTRRCFSSVPDKRVAIVYGTFDKEDSLADAEVIRDLATDVASVQMWSGDNFDFSSLTHASHLVISTSSWLGLPPPNFVGFAHQLLLAAETSPGCLSHLQHAVWGNGDAWWLKTYMNVPRYMDALLERCGSRRFYARGEWGEPHAPARSSECFIEDWAPGMWRALASAERAQPPVAWDALWEYEPSPRHQEMVQWSLRELVAKQGGLDGPPSVLAKPDEAYWSMIAEVKAEAEARRAELAEKRRRAEEERLNQPP